MNQLISQTRTDAGRSKSTIKQQRNDCTVKALALACDMEYDEVFGYLRVAGRKNNHGFPLIQFLQEKPDKVLWGLFGRHFDFIDMQSSPRPVHNVLQGLSKGTWIFWIRHHVFCVKNNEVFDEITIHGHEKVLGVFRVRN